MSKRVFVGIDTSNYTTSCAISSENGEILHNFRILLPVGDGERGLRQSDAVFAHIKNLKAISNMIRENCVGYEIASVGYSAYPRDTQGSYMPCFLAGEAVAQMLSAFLNVPVYQFSHQSGHIRASVYSSKAATGNEFIGFHISGGTTEILMTKLRTDGYYDIQQIGGSIDLHAGQAIDRIGVAMGLKFPCGKEMEQLALKNNKKTPKPKICVSGYDCNLSGLENLALKLYAQENDKLLVSAYVFDFVGETLAKITENLRKEYNSIPLIYAGGVMSNSIIQDRLRKSFDNVYFATAEYSADNASGIALLTRERFFSK